MTKKKITREIVAFILNLFPGLGFYFSGTVHNLKRLRLLGLGLIAAFLFIIPISVVIVHPEPLINYHFTASDLIFPLIIALISGVFGAGVEYEIKEKVEQTKSKADISVEKREKNGKLKAQPKELPRICGKA